MEATQDSIDKVTDSKTAKKRGRKKIYDSVKEYHKLYYQQHKDIFIKRAYENLGKVPPARLFDGSGIDTSIDFGSGLLDYVENKIN
jgi:hypothetical protein